MKERIHEFLKRENKSSAQFAAEIGVQPSGISHILSGRNNPSLDFIIKLLTRYPFISTDWLLFGKGEMYREQTGSDLFAPATGPEKMAEKRDFFNETSPYESGIFNNAGNREPAVDNKKISVEAQRPLKAIRIVVFYEDKSFTEYFPGSE